MQRPSWRSQGQLKEGAQTGPQDWPVHKAALGNWGVQPGELGQGAVSESGHWGPYS